MTPNHDTDRYDNDLHDIFDAATADLTPLPDLVPEAHRIVHRRRLATRSLGAALGAALVIGAGTFALNAPGRSNGSTGLSVQAGSGSASGSPSGSAERDFKTRAAALLQSVWPVRDETIRPAVGDAQSFVVIAPDGKAYPLTLRTDSTKREGTGTFQLEHTIDTSPKGAQTDASLMCYRANVMVSLFIFDTPASLISDAQLHTLESTLLAPGLIEWAKQDGVVMPGWDAQPSGIATPPTPSPSVSTPWTGTPSPSPSLTWY